MRSFNIKPNLLVALLAVLFCGSVLNPTLAQRPEVGLELKNMSVGSFQALTATVDNVSEKLAYNEFRDMMKEYGGRAKKSKPERVKVEQVIINSIGGRDPLDVYADFSERGSSLKIVMWVRQRGEFIGDASGERDLDAASSMLQEFGLRLTRAGIQVEIDDEMKDIDKVERKLRNLERDLEGYERDIERAKAAIERAEDNIVKNKEAQEATREELGQQTEELEAVQDKLANVKG